MENVEQLTEKTIEGVTFHKENVKAAIQTLGGKDKFIEVAKKKYWLNCNEAAQLKRIEAAYNWVMDISEPEKTEAPKPETDAERKAREKAEKDVKAN